MAIKRKEKPDPSELKIALDNRAFEIQLFWQRSNYFLVLITALGIGVFSIRDSAFSALISLAATASSFFWFKTNLGSRFWQESWEAEVELLAKELNIRSFERPMADITKQVEIALGSGPKDSRLRRWVDRQIATKPSVSYHMIKLSLGSTLLWGLVSTIFIWRLRGNIFAIGTDLWGWLSQLTYHCHQ